jgi:hypothetical protein
VQDWPRVDGPGHVARPAHQHGGQEVGDRHLLAQQEGTARFEVVCNPVPGPLDPFARLSLAGLDVGFAGRLGRIEPGAVRRLQRVRQEEHPLGVLRALGCPDRGSQAARGVNVAQVHRDGGRLAERAAVDHQGGNHAGRVELQVLGRLLLTLVEVERSELVGQVELDEQPVHHEGGRARRVIEDQHGRLGLREGR